MSALPSEQEQLVRQIAESAGGTAGREAANARLDTLLVNDLTASLGQLGAELLQTRTQMAELSVAASRHQRALVTWTKVLSVATVAYAVAAFLPLLLGSGVASRASERAWVLWMNNGEVSSEHPWAPFGAFTTQRDCVAGAQQVFNRFKGDEMSVVTEDAAGGVFLITTKPRPSGAMVSVAIKCLPDTVDPRGPTGK